MSSRQTYKIIDRVTGSRTIANSYYEAQMIALNLSSCYIEPVYQVQLSHKKQIRKLQGKS